ncbi:MAG TPA: glycosyltransferase [Opitutus sp.]|nr:glycosyltransferase [Opitutus sp.]
MTVSVLINNWNNAPFLAKCVESALAQTRPADEVIVYDDGSTDGSLEILRSFGVRIRLIAGIRAPGRSKRENQGHAIQQAFRASSADWLALLDGDDLFLPDKIARYRNAAEDNPHASLIQCPPALIDRDGRPLEDLIQMITGDPADPFAWIARHHDCDFFYPTSTLMLHRRVFERSRPFDFSRFAHLGCDPRLCINALFHGPLVTLDSPLTLWRRTDTSISAASARSRYYLLRLTCNRCGYFNWIARLHQRPEYIRLWRNRNFRRRLFGVLLPNGIRRLLSQSRATPRDPRRAGLRADLASKRG